MKGSPATEILPVRVVLLFADTEKATVPFPVPAPPEVIVIQGAVVDAVQVQLGSEAVTPIVPVPPDDENV